MGKDGVDGVFGVGVGGVVFLEEGGHLLGEEGGRERYLFGGTDVEAGLDYYGHDGGYETC